LKPGQKRRKAALFIALSRRAAAINQEFGTAERPFPAPGGTGLLVKAPKRPGYIKLKFGVDYVLARRVRGIRARHIVANERPRVAERLKRGVKTMMLEAINGPV
jgi:hypothetical protein